MTWSITDLSIKCNLRLARWLKPSICEYSRMWWQSSTTRCHQLPIRIRRNRRPSDVDRRLKGRLNLRIILLNELRRQKNSTFNRPIWAKCIYWAFDRLFYSRLMLGFVHVLFEGNRLMCGMEIINVPLFDFEWRGMRKSQWVRKGVENSLCDYDYTNKRNAFSQFICVRWTF